MAEYGVTDTGFKRKPKSVVITELENLMKAKFGQDLDVSPESPEGQIISVIADAIDPMWETAEHSYNAFNPNAATAVTLENLVQINNITKKKATSTTVTVKFTGTDGITIPEGTIVSSNSDDTGGVSYKFNTQAGGIIAGGIYETLAIAQVAGETQIPIGSMILIDTPIVGVDAVTNEAIGNVGQNDETDPELRSRRAIEVALPAVSTTDAIVAGLQHIETVISVVVYENNTPNPITEDGVTISPHSIHVIVQGDLTDEERVSIADVIYIRKDPGIDMDGTDSWDITDSQGFIKTMKWNTPALQEFWIEVDTDATISTALPEDGIDIKNAIVDYINAPATGYKIGNDVSFARLFTPINSIPNHNVQAMRIGFAEFPTGVVDLNIDGGSLAYTLQANILVNINYPL